MNKFFSNIKPNFVSCRYDNIFITIISIGLLLFIGGIYFLKDAGDITRIFYLMVVVPCLFLSPKIIKEFRSLDRSYIIFMLLPIYLCISFIWTAEENIQKDFIYHLRNVFCVFFYMISLWLAMKNNNNFIVKLLLFIFVAGYFSSVISIIYYVLEYGFTTNNILVGYFLDNSNKVGSIYCIHFCLCVFFLFNKNYFNYGTLWNISLIIALMIDVTIIFLTQAVVPWLLIVIFGAIMIMRSWHWLKVLSFFSFALLAGFSLIYYLDIFEYLMGMNRVQIRIDLIRKAIAQMDGKFLFGVGLNYKMPLVNSINNIIHPHPHNIFVDCFRFGGLVGLFLIIGQFVYLIRVGFKSVQNNVEIGFILFWFVAGTALLSFYGQQPLARPGGYIWFFYWTPGVILFIESIIDRTDIQGIEL